MTKKTNLEIVHHTLETEYYNGNDILPDNEFDVLDDQLVIPLDKAKKEKHLIEMGSMPKIRDDVELNRLIKLYGNHRCELEVKLDGAGVELIYEYRHGEIMSYYLLTKAISRGEDGTYGFDVLPKINMIHEVPKAIRMPDTRYGNTLSIRCEYVIPVDEFEYHRHKQGWSHIRGAAVGLLKKEELSFVHRIPKLVYYSIKNEAGEEVKIPYKLMKATEVGKYMVRELSTMYLQALLNEYKDSYKFQIDGIVIHLDDDTLGLHGRYGFKPKRSDIQFTEITGVDWQLSKQGRLNPVANVKPVMLNDSLISKVTLNNKEYIENLGLAIGSVVEVQKAGEIIPEIVKNVTTGNIETVPIEIPSTCPYCGSVVYTENSFLYCSNEKCKERIIKAVEYTFSNVFRLKGMGYAYSKRLVETFGLTKPLDIFKVSAERMILFATNESTNRNLSTLLVKYFKELSDKKIPLRDCYILLNLSHISLVWAEKLASLCPTSHDYIELLKGIIKGKLDHKYDDVHTNVLRSFVLAKDEVLEMFDLLGRHIRLPKLGVLDNKHFCITGSCSKTRQDIIDLIEMNGGTFSNSVSKKTDLLFIGDNPGQTKIAKAIQYQTKTKYITDEIIDQLIHEKFILT